MVLSEVDRRRSHNLFAQGGGLRPAGDTSDTSDTMNSRPSLKRRFAPSLFAFERRELLTGSVPTAVWIGQDGHDLAGGAQPLTGNGVQDLHVGLTGIPASRTIASVDILGNGGGEWVENIGNYSPFNAVLVETPGTTTADLYLDPYQVETGRWYDITLKYDDASSVTFRMNGGTANPNLRMPAYALTDTWAGQDGKDLTSLGPGVGPDGNQDAHITLSQLFPSTSLSSVTVTASPSGTGWAWGTNPGLLNNAELIANANDPTKADLYFSPNANLNGQTLTVTVVYSDGKQDHATLAAGTTNPALAMPATAAVKVNWNTIAAQWSGQDGLNLLGAGDAHVSISGIPSGRTVVSASLNDPVGSVWVYLRPNSGATTAEPVAMSLGFRAGGDPTKADITFPPNRNESGSTLTVRLVLDNGSILATRLTAGATDPGLRVADIASTSVVAYPGDDLNSLANSYGTVRLAAGVYPLAQPLILNHPVKIEGAPGSLLVFSQAVASPTWTAAIKVNSSHTTLTGFAVRFATPIRWTDNISYGPAVIGATDNYDLNNYDSKVDLVFSNLDLQAPPALTSWEEAPRLFRLNNAESGSILGNLMKGGTTEFFGGPWIISGNTYLGTLPNTFSNGVFSGHYTHDLLIANNQASNSGPSGKTWRFLVLTQDGLNDVVRNNNVVGLGPMDSDTVPNPNAPEVILTEAYRVHYEGITANVSSDGLVVQIPSVLAGQVRSGDVISILNGSQAGQWRLISQVINSTTFLLDTAIVPGSFDISVATGFVNMVIDGNTVDSRGSSVADDLVLAGNQYGATVTNNHLLGGDRGFRISAFPTESPNIWGWSHAPFLGALIQNNTLIDTRQGGMLDVERSQYTKSSTGRVYFSGAFLDNKASWTSAYLASRSSAGINDPLRLITVGNSLIADPGELVLTASGNSVSGPSAVSGSSTFLVLAGTLNGTSMTNQFVTIPLTSTPSSNPVLGSIQSTGQLAATELPGAQSQTNPITATSAPVITAPVAVSNPSEPISMKGAPTNSVSQRLFADRTQRRQALREARAELVQSRLKSLEERFAARLANRAREVRSTRSLVLQRLERHESQRPIERLLGLFSVRSGLSG